MEAYEEDYDRFVALAQEYEEIESLELQLREKYEAKKKEMKKLKKNCKPAEI